MSKIKIPDEIVKFYDLSEEELDARISFLAVMDLLRQERVSRGKAAELLGISPYEALDLIELYDISNRNRPMEDLEKEWKLWEKIKNKKSNN